MVTIDFDQRIVRSLHFVSGREVTQEDPKINTHTSQLESTKLELDVLYFYDHSNCLDLLRFSYLSLCGKEGGGGTSRHVFGKGNFWGIFSVTILIMPDLCSFYRVYDEQLGPARGWYRTSPGHLGARCYVFDIPPRKRG